MTSFEKLEAKPQKKNLTVQYKLLSPVEMINANIITSNFPIKGFPERGAFVENLAREWKKLGVNVTVINPTSLQNQLRYGIIKGYEVVNHIPVYRPVYLSFSNYEFGGCSTQQLSSWAFYNAALSVCKKIGAPDFYYGKFLFSGGQAAQKVGLHYQKPSFVDIGESRKVNELSEKEKQIAKNVLTQVSGVFCVSKRLAKEVMALGALPQNVFLAPNTVDTNRFKPLKQKDCRKKLNLPSDAFIVIFVGHFIERKGPLRVLKALNTLDLNVVGVFLGRGNQKPKGERVLYHGAVLNENLPLWLNSADVFVLPTLAEGHCNAINEAMACGLPIISSDIPDIHHQVPKEAGIFVNPRNEKEIADAIKLVHNNVELRKRLLIKTSSFLTKQQESRPEQVLNVIFKHLNSRAKYSEMGKKV